MDMIILFLSFRHASPSACCRVQPIVHEGQSFSGKVPSMKLGTE